MSRSLSRSAVSRSAIVAMWLLSLVLSLTATAFGQPPTRRFLPARPARPAAAAEKPAPAEEGADPSEASTEDATADEGEPTRPPRLLENIRTRTFGGVQFWGDEIVFRDWRIQRHAITGHCRLLDPDDRRQTWGSFETCQQELEKVKKARGLKPVDGPVVIVLHGLGGWRGTMDKLTDYISANSKLTVVSISYPSTRGDIEQHAKALKSVIDHLPEASEINFVGHSLGNLVIRHYLADEIDGSGGKGLDPRIKRFVMLAPPNHGAERADKWSDNDLFVTVLGESAVQLGSGWAAIESKLAVPTCEFGVIAGGRGDEGGYSSRLQGDDDGTLSVATTRLVGARDFTIIPVWHSFMMFHPTVQEYTLRFLQKGFFTTDDEREPILEDDPKEDVQADDVDKGAVNDDVEKDDVKKDAAKKDAVKIDAKASATKKPGATKKK